MKPTQSNIFRRVWKHGKMYIIFHILAQKKGKDYEKAQG